MRLAPGASAIIGYLEHNREGMRYDAYRRARLPTTSDWTESAVKALNYRVKGAEVFWNNPVRAEAILQICAGANCTLRQACISTRGATPLPCREGAGGG